MSTNILGAPCGENYDSNKQILRSNSIPDDKSVPSGNNENAVAVPPKRRKCCPYDFDSRLCQVVGDRVLCGFNRNIGRPAGANDVSVELTGGCRIRGGRLECGYDGEGPFVNPRRPPAWNNNPDADDTDDSIEGMKESYNDEAETSINRLKYMIPPTNKPLNVSKLSYVVPPNKKPSGDVTKCIEVKERIVCKD